MRITRFVLALLVGPIGCSVESAVTSSTAPVVPVAAGREEPAAPNYVFVTGTVYYEGNPVLGRHPLGVFHRGAEVQLVKRSGSYSLVRGNDGTEGYVAADTLRPVEAQ